MAIQLHTVHGPRTASRDVPDDFRSTLEVEFYKFTTLHRLESALEESSGPSNYWVILQAVIAIVYPVPA